MNLSAAIIQAGCGATPLRATQWLAAIEDACDRYAIDRPLRVAAFLAQIGHESLRLEFTREIWGPTTAQRSYEGSIDLGNTQVGDGKRFMGRGLIEVTGRDNYARAGEALGLDLLAHPALLEEPDHAAMSAAWFWSSKGLNALADDQLFIAITKRVNGGVNGLAERQGLYLAAKKALGV